MRRAAVLVAVLLVASGCAGTAARSGAGPGAQPRTPGSSPTPVATPFVPSRVSVRTVGWHLSVPLARQALITTAPGIVVLAGGMRADDTSTATAYRIDLSSGRIRSLAPLAVPVHDAAGGPYAGLPAVFGGGNSAEQSLVQAFSGERWRRVDAFPTTRSDLSVVALPGRTLALGGYDGTAVPTPIFVQQGHAPMHPQGALATGVRYAATAVAGPAVYVFGGEVAGRELDAVQRVDLRTGRTRVVARLPHPLGHAMAATFGPRILLMGGRTSPDVQTAALWWFDPVTRAFTRAGRLPRVLSDAAVAVSGRSAYLLGGEDPGVTDRVVRVRVG